MRLQRNPFALGARQEIAQPRDGRIASVRTDDDASDECFSDDVDLPIFGGGPIERDQRCFLANFSSECARPVEKKMVEQAALDRDLAVNAAWKIDPEFLAADGNEFHRVKHTVRRVSNLFGELESLQDGPARGIDAITTNFFTWKFFPLQDQGSQSGGRAESRAGRTGRSTTNNRYIDNFHLVQCQLSRERLQHFWRAR